MIKKLSILLLLPSLAFAGPVNKAMEASVVVHLKVMTRLLPGMEISHRRTCSGVYISNTEIVTAAHCVTNPVPYEVWITDPKGPSVRVKRIVGDTDYDLAILQVASQKHIYVRFGKSAELQDKVFNIGCPGDVRFLCSEGIVAGLDRIAPEDTPKARYTITTAPIGPGSSGGGLFNSKGQLIGINTMTMYSVFSWAVNTDSIKSFLKERP